MMGRIMRCSDVAQARFMRLCCLYWNKQGELSREDAQLELLDSWDELLALKIVFLDGEYVGISFLDEQLEEVDSISKKRSASAKKRWKVHSKCNASASKNDASAMQVHKGAMQDYAEEKRGEEKRREEKRKNRDIPPLPPKGEARPQSVEDVCDYFKHLGLNGISEQEAEKFWAYYQSVGWKVGKNPMKDWKSAAVGWKSRIPPEKYQKKQKQKLKAEDFFKG